MEIGAVGFSPYIYNVNSISSGSLSKIAGIGEDLLAGKTDFSDMSEGMNENPLKRGETSNFIDVLDMQMQIGKMNASRVMKPVEETQGLEEMQADNAVSAETLEISDTEAAIQSAVMPEESGMDAADAMEVFKPVSGAEEMLSMQADRNLFQMQRAAQAYQVHMIA